MSAISFRNVSKSFGPVEALQNIDLEIDEGEFVALIGPSGCGKTTMLRHVIDLETATLGEVLVGGKSPGEVRRETKLGTIFQRPALVPSNTVLQNVQMTLDITSVDSPISPKKNPDGFRIGRLLSPFSASTIWRHATAREHCSRDGAQSAVSDDG